MIGDFMGKHILHGKQFGKEDLEKIMNLADEFEKDLEKYENLNILAGKVLATLFFEPSTRTRLSFETAMLKLGGHVISVPSGEGSAVKKGETIGDTALTVSQYADIIVIRHPIVGAVDEASTSAIVPVINAGDGIGQHPTQALLDVYTIKKEVGKFDGITVGLMGDLKYGRTVHALVEPLSLYDVKMYFISPKSIRMPENIVTKLKEKGVSIVETEDLVEAARDCDVMYATRIQKERFSEVKEYEKLKGCYVINNEFLAKAKKNIIIMHPLVRVDEIATEIDSYKGAAYFRQVRNGVFVRMALLALILGVRR